MLLKNRQRLLIRIEKKWTLKKIIGTDEKYRDKKRNALLYLPKEQAEKIAEIDKRIKREDLIYQKHNFNRYGTIISPIYNVLTEVTDTVEMHEMLNEFKNEISELKSDYLPERDEVTNDVIENASIVDKNQLSFLKKYIEKNKQRTLTKRISSEKLSKPGLSTSPSLTQFPSQETIAERVKLKPQERKIEEQD